jgi:predicted ATP-grasp superfamily ATP-dependent carboligase
MALSATEGPVLVGFAEALAGPEAVFSLLDDDRHVAAFHRAGRRPPLARASGVALHPIVAPEDDAAAAVAELVALAREIGAIAVMPLDDAAVWLCAEAAAELSCPVVGPTGEQAVVALDKERQLELAVGAGLEVPDTIVSRTPEALLDLDRFPVVLKPALAAVVRDGRLTRGSAVTVADRDSLQRTADAWDATGPRLAQPLLRGIGGGLFGLARPAGGIDAWSAHRRLRMLNPAGSGSSACSTAPVDLVLATNAERFLSAAGWHGLFMVETLRDAEGRNWFMELNGRSWGSMALARRRGLEYPAWALRDALALAREGRSAPLSFPSTSTPDFACRHVGRDLVHLLAVLRGPAQPVADWPSRASTVRAVLRPGSPKCWYNWRDGSRGVFVQDTMDTVVSALRRTVAR